FKKMPKIVNPEKGWVANANNKITETPYYISAYWATYSRYNRIKQYLSSNDQFTSRAFQVMQLDTYSSYSQKIIHQVLPVLVKSGNEFPIAVKYLRNWSYFYKKTETAATILEIFKLNLSENTFQDEMGEVAYKYFIAFGAKPARALKRFLREGSVFFDNVHTLTIETRDQIIKKS